MYSLLIDASIKKTIISINKKNIPLENLYISENFKIFLYIKKLLKKAKITINDLSFISISIGPGSYTGTRIAAAIAKSISYAKNIPIIGFSSLMGFIPKISTPFFSIMEAKSKGIYLLKGEKKEKKIIYKSTPLLLPIEEIKNFLDKKHMLLSPDFDILKKQIPSLKKALINKEHLAEISFEKFQNKKHDSLNLLYNF